MRVEPDDEFVHLACNGTTDQWIVQKHIDRLNIFVEACLAHVTDPWLRSLPLVGSVDQVADSTDLLSVAGRADHLLALYEGEHFPDIHGDPDA